MAVETGHNATLAVELGLPPVMGVFTSIPNLTADIMGFSATRDWTQFTPHGSEIDRGASGAIKRGPLNCTLIFDPSNATHTGLRDAFTAPLKVNRRRGFRFWGPSGSAGTDEVIQSGEITGWEDTAPEDAGLRSVAVTINFDGDAWIDGTLVGNIGE